MIEIKVHISVPADMLIIHMIYLTRNPQVKVTNPIFRIQDSICRVKVMNQGPDSRQKTKIGLKGNGGN